MRASAAAAAAGLVLVASSAFADGKVFGSRPAAPVEAVSEFIRANSPARADELVAAPSIPDQRALIVQRDGKETLVIETAFKGRGTDFAWVVPTPSVPKIEPASTDLFVSLDDATRPQLISRVPDLRIAGLCVVAALLIARHGLFRRARHGPLLAAVVVGVGVLVETAVPHDGDGANVLTLGASGAFDVRLPMTPEEAPVAVRQREVVGAFDAVTISARDPHALVEWLHGHDFATPPGLEDVAAQYVRDGWVFNAMRIRRDADRADAVRIHPLSFTFDAPTPVYPMRLTGVASGPVDVELYVAGARRAAADGFDERCCATLSTDWSRMSGGGFAALGAPDVARLVRGAAVVTRLDRTFAPDAMGVDVPVGWTDFAPSQRVVFSNAASTALAWNAGALVAIAAFVGLASAGSGASSRRPRPPRRPARAWMATALVLVLAADVGVAIAAFTPTVPTRTIQAGR
jgi:hypothetical protein